MKRIYVVRMPLPDGVEWFDLCRCEDATKVAAIVAAILAAAEGEPIKLLVESQLLG